MDVWAWLLGLKQACTLRWYHTNVNAAVGMWAINQSKDASSHLLISALCPVSIPSALTLVASSKELVCSLYKACFVR